MPPVRPRGWRDLSASAPTSQTIESAPNMHTIQYDEQTHINCPGPIRFCNHSCAPNCTMQARPRLRAAPLQ